MSTFVSMNGPFIPMGPFHRPPTPRDPAVSFRCHLATQAQRTSEHNNCDGMTYGPALTTQGTPCICACHIGQVVPKRIGPPRP